MLGFIGDMPVAVKAYFTSFSVNVDTQAGQKRLEKVAFRQRG
jgi:hypothetical protein